MDNSWVSSSHISKILRRRKPTHDSAIWFADIPELKGAMASPNSFSLQFRWEKIPQVKGGRMADNTDTNNVSGCILKLTYEGENSGLGNQEGVLKEQDHLLPIANVGRIMKQILPSNAKISKEAKETMQECVSEFISFVTSEASDKCRKEKRKTLNGDDICWALGSLGFDDYSETIKTYLLRYRESECERANQNRVGNINEENVAIEPSRNNPVVSDTGNRVTTINFNL